MHMSIRFLLFDVDETLYPSSCAVWPMLRERIIQYMVERVGMTRDAAEALRDRYLKEYGTTTRGLYLNNHIDIGDYLRYVHDVPINTVLFNDPELGRVLAQLPGEKCLFTNATREHALNVARCLGVQDFFAHIFSLEDFDYVSKPDPHPYEVVLSRLGARGEECLLLEDSLRNIATGKRFGMTTILVSEQPNALNGVVDFHITRVHDILGVMARLAS